MYLWYEVVATWFGCGRVPRAQGTAGSVAALLFFPLVIIDCLASFFLFVALFLIGTRAVVRYLDRYPSHLDPKEVVVDEVCGQLLVFVIMVALDHGGFINLRISTLQSALALMLIGLVTFRIYDAVKPWPICVVDQNMHGALGVMLDDIVAAVPAIIVTLAAVSACIM